MRCPNCDNKLLQKSGKKTRVRVRGAMTFDEEGLCKSQCYWCKTEVIVPLRIDPDVEIESERFVLTKGR